MTHVFIVNDTTLKYHLEYMFAGTGANCDAPFLEDPNYQNPRRKEDGLTATAERNLAAMVATDKMDSIEYSTKDKLSRQTDSLKEQLHTKICRMMNELKAKDLTPWKLKLKWAAVGAILPSMFYILQLILR